MSYRPMYMASMWPLAAVCKTIPSTATTAAPIRESRLPHFSAIGEATRAPKKHPAWSVETILADRFAAATLEMFSSPYVLHQ